MFQKKYFPNQYFPRSYFPGGSTGAATPPATVYGYQSEDERAAAAAISHGHQQMPWWLKARQWNKLPPAK